VTAQVPDTIVIDGTEHGIAGIDGGPLFDPAVHRIELAMLHTACWRGHICAYTLWDERLLLHALTVGPDTTVDGVAVSTGPSFSGELFADNGYGEYMVAPMRLEIPFSGRLLAARGLLVSLHVNMGFAPGWKYEHVIELILDEGRLVGRRDRSGDIAEIRRAILEGELPDPDGERGGRDWVNRTFDLDYDRTFPRR
jgi:hypothetical protein